MYYIILNIKSIETMQLFHMYFKLHGKCKVDGKILFFCGIGYDVVRLTCDNPKHMN